MPASEFQVNFTFRNIWIESSLHNPTKFWGWLPPYNIAIKLAFVALNFLKDRRADIAALATMILLFLAPYWHH
jgi:hypothetical protein